MRGAYHRSQSSASPSKTSSRKYSASHAETTHFRSVMGVMLGLCEEHAVPLEEGKTTTPKTASSHWEVSGG